MKKIIITVIMVLFALTANAQKDSVRISIPAKVISSNGKTLLADSNYNRYFEINTSRELVQGKEYDFILKYSTEERKNKHCIGCTGLLPAKLIDYSITPEQAKIDIIKMKKRLKIND